MSPYVSRGLQHPVFPCCRLTMRMQSELSSLPLSSSANQSSSTVRCHGWGRRSYASLRATATFPCDLVHDAQYVYVGVWLPTLGIRRHLQDVGERRVLGLL